MGIGAAREVASSRYRPVTYMIRFSGQWLLTYGVCRQVRLPCSDAAPLASAPKTV
jgi:hypothetical protein